MEDVSIPTCEGCFSSYWLSPTLTCACFISCGHVVQDVAIWGALYSCPGPCLSFHQLQRYSCMHLADHPPIGYVAMYASILHEAQLQPPPPPLAISFMEFTSTLWSTYIFLFYHRHFLLESPTFFVGLALSHLIPNSFSRLMAFDHLCFLMEILSSKKLFCCFHNLMVNKSDPQCVDLVGHRFFLSLPRLCWQAPRLEKSVKELVGKSTNCCKTSSSDTCNEQLSNHRLNIFHWCLQIYIYIYIG